MTVSDDFKAGFELAKELASLICQRGRETGETDLRDIKSSIEGLASDLTVEKLKAEFAEFD